MKIIPREAGRITYSTEIRNLKKRLVLSDYQKSVVVGSILGDGYLFGNWSKTNYRFGINQSVKQKDYLVWKYNILKDWTLSEPKYYERTKSISFRTVSHQQLTKFSDIFYPDKKKIIPKNIENFLNPITIAIWYMDDGNIRRDNGKVYGYYLNTQSFSEEENHFLRKVLKDKFGINFLVLKNKGRHRLYVGVDRNKFKNLIEDLIIPSMQYKLG